MWVALSASMRRISLGLKLLLACLQFQSFGSSSSGSFFALVHICCWTAGLYPAESLVRYARLPCEKFRSNAKTHEQVITVENCEQNELMRKPNCDGRSPKNQPAITISAFSHNHRPAPSVTHQCSCAYAACATFASIESPALNRESSARAEGTGEIDTRLSIHG